MLTFVTADPASGPARLASGSYFAEIARRFGFDRSQAEAEAEKDAALLVPPHGLFVLAVAGPAIGDGIPVACGGYQAVDEHTAELKRMWVHEYHRREGLGTRLLRHLEAQARTHGHTVIRLDTNAALTEAIAMYERNGYYRIARYNDNPWATHFFEKKLA